jgi:hypothetical protein
VADPELIKKWSLIESELRAALASVRSDLSDGEARQIAEYLDHNELGLALELLMESLLASEATGLPRSTLGQLHRANDEMGDPSPDLWEKFTRRLR